MQVLASDFTARGWKPAVGLYMDPSYLNADKTEWTKKIGASDGYNVRFNIQKTAGRRIIASADILTDNIDVARVYFRVFDKNGNRIDTASQGQHSKARITGQYHRVSCSIDCLHPDIRRVQICFGSLAIEADTGNVKVRNPTIQVGSIPCQKSTPDWSYVGDSDNGGYIESSTGYAKIWKLQYVDLADSTTDVAEPVSPGLKEMSSSGFCVVSEEGLAVDKEHLSSMFLRWRPDPTRQWTLFNANPKPTSRLVPMRFWAEGFIDL